MKQSKEHRERGKDESYEEGEIEKEGGWRIRTRADKRTLKILDGERKRIYFTFFFFCFLI